MLSAAVAPHARPRVDAARAPLRGLAASAGTGSAHTTAVHTTAVHAAWVPGSGLAWWVDGPVGLQPPSGRHPGALVASERRRWAQESLGDGALTVALRGPARTARLLLPSTAAAAAGSLVPAQRSATPSLAVLRVPVACSPPAVSMAALLHVAGAEGEQVGGEVVYLARFAEDLRRWVAAGRVVPRVDDDGRARWVLAPGDDVSAWWRGQLGALPPVLRAGARRGERASMVAGSTARQVLEEMTASFVDTLVRERLPVGGPDEHPLISALRGGSALLLEPVRVRRLRDDLDAWVASRRRRAARLALRLQEPAVDLADGELVDNGGPDDSKQSVRWPLDVLLSIDDEAPVSISGLTGDEEALSAVRSGLAAVIDRVPALEEAERDDADPGRLWLTTRTALHLVDRGAELQQACDVTLLLPREWTRVAPTLHLDVGEVQEDEEGLIGLQHLVAWDWSVALGEDRLTQEELTELAQAKDGLVQLRGEWVRVDVSALAAARRFVVRSAARPRGDLAALLTDLTSGDAPPVPVAEVRARGWLEPLFATGEARTVEEVPQPAGLRATLRPYQRRGLSWLAFMERLGLGAVLADDMGLGKTIQVLSLLLHERETGGESEVAPTLLACPKSLLSTWVREAARFAPSLRVRVHHGSTRPRGEEFGTTVTDLVVTTYGTLALDIDLLSRTTWQRIVLDEAHQVKNTATKQAKAVRTITARHRLALTGTPVENRLEELRGVLDTVNPGLLGSAEGFARTFARPIEIHRDAAAASRLRTLTQPFLLRRLKTDKRIISDLPDKIEMVVPVTLTREQASLYQATVTKLLRDVDGLTPFERRGAVLRALTHLKQICNHPAHFLGDGSPLLKGRTHRSGKLEAVDDILDEVIAEGDRALLFTQFTAFGSMLAPYLSRRFGVEVPFLNGATTRRQRDEMVRRFQEDDDLPFLLLSLKAGGTGLTLTRANHVLHLDRWWNPAVENQATDRAFRIGQQRTVQVRKMVTSGTLEERIDAIIAGKSALADLVVGGSEGWVTELGTDALRELLTLSKEALDV